MTDAISRSAVLNELIEAKSQVSKVRTDYAEIINETLDIFANTINKQPALDVAPVVHARWVLDSSFYSARIYHCTACNIKQMQTSKFCPECGARMDGEVE